MDTVQTIVVAVISSGVVGSILVFVQFLITRHDNKAEKSSEVIKAINDLKDKVENLEEKICKVDAKADEKEAVQARIRLLRNADELQQDSERRHTKDWFDQMMSDISTYEDYCELHPKFKNNQTAATVKYLSEVYDERMIKKDWGTYGNKKETK